MKFPALHCSLATFSSFNIHPLGPRFRSYWNSSFEMGLNQHFLHAKCSQFASVLNSCLLLRHFIVPLSYCQYFYVNLSIDFYLFK